jgi:hypothetical protein
VLAVEGAPDFGYDEEFFASDKTFGNCPTDTFSALLVLIKAQTRERVPSRYRNLERNQKDDSQL